MRLPRVIKNSVTVPPSIISPFAPASAGGGGGGGGGYQLPFVMETQEQTNWCWSAVSVSIALFKVSNSGWEQCKLASQELGLTCCATPVPGSCNAVWYLEKALQRVGHLDHWVSGPESSAGITQELSAGQPLGCRIGWQGGGGHFVAITGIQPTASGDDVTVEDPLYGQSVVPAAVFQSSYRTSGTWTHTYYVK